MIHRIPRLAFATVVLLISAYSQAAKILIYHHVAEGTPASTSVTPETFASHLELIEGKGYEVVPLSQIVTALVDGTEISPLWVAITFDDAYKSVFTQALPMLGPREWPFTVFVSTDFIDQGSDLYMSWDELRILEQKNGVMANHSRGHEHLIQARTPGGLEAWQELRQADLAHAQQRLDDELDHPERWLAYPFGEFDSDLAALAKAMGYISFAQQSGPVGSGTDLYSIPRFPLATGFDDVKSLAEKLRTRYLPLIDAPLPANVLAPDAPAPTLTWQLLPDTIRKRTLTCFIAGQPKAELEFAELEQVSITATRPLRPGRSKYTCTAPHPKIPGAYYWRTHLWIKPFPDGSWYPG